MKYAWLMAIFLMLFMVPPGGLASEKQDMGGWEKDGDYNRLYDVNEMDTFKATVVDVSTEVPLPGMSPGVVLKVRDQDEELVTAHICPVWFEKPAGIGLRRGDRIKLRGAWAEIDGKDVFLVSKIKKDNDWQYKVRLTSDGTPFWTMTPEQLEKERNTD